MVILHHITLLWVYMYCIVYVTYFQEWAACMHIIMRYGPQKLGIIRTDPKELIAYLWWNYSNLEMSPKLPIQVAYSWLLKSISKIAEQFVPGPSRTNGARCLYDCTIMYVCIYMYVHVSGDPFGPHATCKRSWPYWDRVSSAELAIVASFCYIHVHVTGRV